MINLLNSTPLLQNMTDKTENKQTQLNKTLKTKRIIKTDKNPDVEKCNKNKNNSNIEK